MPEVMPINLRFARYAWGVLALNLFVIIWGAFVRASGSGAGCGSHWPLCNGVLIPQPQHVATWIEFAHRITSGLALLSVIVMLVWALRAYPRGHRVRAGAVAAMIFMIIEALVGAALVLLEYVAFNVSVGRAIWMGTHLVNTLILTAALTLTAWWGSGGPPVRLRGQGSVGVTLLLAMLGMLVLGVSGAITALGDTLVITGGITPEQNALVAQLVSLRIFHPLIAITVGCLVALAAWVCYRKRPTIYTLRFGQAAVALFVLQLCLGALNVALRAPLWLQMVHLLITSTIWILLVLLAAAALGQKQPVTAGPATGQPAAAGQQAAA